jgi:hypothetical protein
MRYSKYGGQENCIVLAQKPEGKRPLIRSRHRWDDNIIMYLKEIRWE